MFKLSYILHPRKLLSLLAVLSCLPPLAAQDELTGDLSNRMKFEHIGEESAVSNVIQCIYADTRGFIWMGTGTEGLYRYDGYEFEHYQYIHDDSTSISDNFVTNFLYEDRSGNLWITLFSGEINRYNRDTDDFTRFRQSLVGHSPLSGFVSSITGDQQGNIWIGMYHEEGDELTGGLCLFKEEEERYIAYKNNPADTNTLAEDCISKTYVDRSGSLWIGTCSSGVDRFVPGRNGNAGRFVHYRNISGNPDIPISSTITDITEDRSGTIWIGTEHQGVLRYLEDEDQFRRYAIHADPSSQANLVSILAPDHDGVLWIGTGDGLALYDHKMDTIILHRHDPGDPSSIPMGQIRSIAHSPDGIVWIIILTDEFGFSDGITCFDPESAQFLTFRNDPLDPNSISSNNVNTAIVDQSGILWIGTLDGGINIYNPSKQKFHLLEYNPMKPNGIPRGKIYSVIEDSRGILWIGTVEYGLFRLDRTKGIITNYVHNPSDPRSINNNNILTICEGDSGTLWLGGLGGLNKLDTETMEFRSFAHDPGNQNSIGANHIMSIIRDREGILWMGTLFGGLNRFDPETEQFTSFRRDPDNPKSLDWNDGILSVYEGLDGSMWLSTFEGLYKYIRGIGDNDDQLIHYYHEDDNPNSLSYNTVRMVVEDKSGNLWIATEGGGLNKFDIKTEEFTIYTEDHGLPSNSVQGILIDESGHLWLSSNRGLSRFNPLNGRIENFNLLDGLQSLEFAFGGYYKSPAGEFFFCGEKGLNYFFPEEVKMNSYLPPVVITDFKLFNKSVVAGEDSPLKKSITEIRELDLKHNENFISFEFAALNYTNTSKNQYKYRMLGLDNDTVYIGARRLADFTDLKPGSYTFWVTGSNNDGKWNKEGISLDIVVHPPWWRTNLAYGLYVLTFLLFLIGYIRWQTYRLRKEKENLEIQVRERTRKIEEKDSQILQMDRMKTRFFANISHEFRTPITLILNRIEEMLTSDNPGDRVREKLSVIQRNGKQLLKLVSQLLDISRLDSGKLKIELVENDIIKFLKLICSSFLSLAETNNIHYDIQLPGDEIIAQFDSGKLETIMNNLLSNAFKYTPEGGEIKCIVEVPRVKKGDSRKIIKISVKDSGPGIYKKHLPLIFDRFYQSDEHRHLDGGGTGIGLSFTRELVLMLKGEIEVKSKPGTGACFDVTLPLGTDHLKESEYIILKKTEEKEDYLEKVTDLKESETEIAATVSKQHVNKTIQILIVEDNNELRAYLIEQFETEYKVEEAVNGEDGLKKAIKSIPDLIVSDIMMPQIDGFEFCRRIKTNERTSHIPFIMLTAKADIDSRIEGLETAADDYIIKPFNIQEVKARVKNLITQRQILRNKYATSLDITRKEIAFNSKDVQFMNRIIKIVEEHISDMDFEVSDLQKKSELSHTQLYRKIFALTGLSPSKFIRNIRLESATKLMEQNNQNITEIALNVGFGNLSYFTKCFRERYGITPSDYLRQS